MVHCVYIQRQNQQVNRRHIKITYTLKLPTYLRPWSPHGAALTRGRTDHFAAGVIQFPFRVCFSAILLELVFPSSLSRPATHEWASEQLLNVPLDT